jgi:hypothetical protein
VQAAQKVGLALKLGLDVGVAEIVTVPVTVAESLAVGETVKVLVDGAGVGVENPGQA